MRFIGAPRQPIVGVRRLAYIPDGETPTEAHFLVAGKSASSTTERLPVAGITGVSNHHVAVWYAATLPEMDLFTSDNTIRNYRTSFGEPMALEVDGLSGFYHVTGSLTRQDVPSQNFDAFYAESRDGEILKATYGAYKTTTPFVASDFTAAGASVVGLSNTITFPLPDIPPAYYTTAASLPVTDPAVYTGSDGVTRPIREDNTITVPAFSGDRFVLIAIPNTFGDIDLTTIDSRDLYPSAAWMRDTNQDITIEGVDYKVWRSDAAVSQDAGANLTFVFSVETPRDIGVRYLAFAVPDDGPDLISVRPSTGFGFPDIHQPAIGNGKYRRDRLQSTRLICSVHSRGWD